MGLLDGVLGNVVGSMLNATGSQPGGQSPLGALIGSLTAGNPSQGTNLLNAALSIVQQQGGLQAVLAKFQQAGLGAHVDSWVGTGANMNLSADQLQKALGSGSLGTLATQLGMSNGAAGAAMAKLLPELVNHFTPQGQLPGNHADLLTQALSALQK